MASVSVNKIAGLVVSGNTYTLPEGALHQADNVVIRAKDLLEPRRGHTVETNGFGTSSAYGNTHAFYGGGRVVQFTDTTEKLAYAAAANGSYTTYSGTYNPVEPLVQRMKFAELGSNLYFNTSVGVKVLTSLSGTPGEAGMRKVSDFFRNDGSQYLTGTPSGAGSWFAADRQVAYRYTLVTKDANGYVKESAPSGRLTVVNPAAVTSTGGIVRTAGTTVTATVANHGFKAGQYVTISPGEADGGDDYGVGPHVITSTTATTIVWTEAGIDGTSTAAQTLSSGTVYVSFYAILPDGVTTDHSIRIYRSRVSASATTDPSDELYQIYEAKVTAAQITAGTVYFDDKTPESSLYASPLYTNPKTGDGIGQANDQPPLCKDLCVWKERLWFANTTSKHRYTTQLIGIGSPDGLQTGDSITIGGRTFIAGTDFLIFTSSGSAAENTKNTAHDLIYRINVTAQGVAPGANWLRAYYISGENDAPGKILFEEEALAGSAFYFSASRTTSWSPAPPPTIAVTEASSGRTTNVVTITATAHGFATGDSILLSANSPHALFAVGIKTSITVTNANVFTYAETGTNSATIPSGVYYVSKLTAVSDNDAAPHKLFYSKFQQPEAVPLLNYLTVGAKNQDILRIVPLRDKLFVFKEDAVYMVSGDAGLSLRVDVLDNTVRLLAPDSVALVNNQIYALTNQGVVAVSEGGVGIVSRNIESLLQADFMSFVNAGTTTQKAGVWGCAYDTERSYLVSVGSETGQDDVLVYNVMTKTWTRWPDLDFRFAAVDPVTDKLHFLPASGAVVRNKMQVERKAFTAYDYADGGFAARIFSPGHDDAANILAHWKFNEAAATDSLVDSGPHVCTLTDFNSPGVADGPASGARSYTAGTSQYFNGNANATIRSALLGSCTVKAMVYRGSGTERIVALGGTARINDTDNLLLSFFVSAAGYLVSYHDINTAGFLFNQSVQNIGTPVPLNQWTHVAMVRTVTGATCSIRFFVDGVFQQQFSGIAIPTGGSASNWYVGSDSVTRSTGLQDDTVVLSVAQTDAEIAASAYTALGVGTARTEIALVASGETITEGDILSDAAGTTNGRIHAVNGNNLTVPSAVWRAGPATISTAFASTVEFAPNAFGSPGTSKHFSEAHLHFQRLNAYELNAQARTDLSAVAVESVLHPRGYVAAANTLTSAAPTLQNQRLLIPLEKQRGTVLRYGMNIREAGAVWQLCGYSAEVDGGSERSQR